MTGKGDEDGGDWQKIVDEDGVNGVDVRTPRGNESKFKVESLDEEVEVTDVNTIGEESKETVNVGVGGRTPSGIEEEAVEEELRRSMGQRLDKVIF